MPMPEKRAWSANLAVPLLIIITISILKPARCTDGASRQTLDVSEQTDSWLTNQGDCRQMYASRRFITEQEVTMLSSRASNTSSSQQSEGQHDGSAASSSWCPALLWTYTGTGNTMTRMLIEAASGWYTGSVYTGEVTLFCVLPFPCITGCSMRTSKPPRVAWYLQPEFAQLRDSHLLCHPLCRPVPRRHFARRVRL